MPLKAAKEHLPKDISNILELLGKVDNIPFNQLYSLAEDCADRYYTKVIKTLAQLSKHSNSWNHMWQDKYDRLPDHFYDLQTTLQTEFSLLKKATSKNIENLQEAINLQQTYTTSLCGHINSIYAKLAQLDQQVQTHCLYPHSQSNVVQINALEYDSDIDGQTDQLPDIQPSMALHTALLRKHHHMLKTSKKTLSQSPPILENTQPLCRLER